MWKFAPIAVIATLGLEPAAALPLQQAVAVVPTLAHSADSHEPLFSSQQRRKKVKKAPRSPGSGTTQGMPPGHRM